MADITPNDDRPEADGSAPQSEPRTPVDTGRRRAMGKLAYVAPVVTALAVSSRPASAFTPPGPPS